jgi:hypothetical protein
LFCELSTVLGGNSALATTGKDVVDTFECAGPLGHKVVILGARREEAGSSGAETDASVFEGPLLFEGGTEPGSSFVATDDEGDSWTGPFASDSSF